MHQTEQRMRGSVKSESIRDRLQRSRGVSKSMKKKTYTIGLDYGSLSCRGILADTENGQILGEEVFDYPHGILESCLPDGTPVEGEWFLQHPGEQGKTEWTKFKEGKANLLSLMQENTKFPLKKMKLKE